MFNTSIATICPITSLLQYHWLYFLFSAFYSMNYSFHNWRPVSPTPLHLFCPITHPYPLATISSLYLKFWFCFLFIHFFRFHLWTESYGICVSQSGLFYLAYYLLGPSMLSQIAQYHPFIWVCNILECVCARTHVCMGWWKLRLLPCPGYCK